ncbi:MAG: UDP-glucose 4-epimerase, partial [Bacilli bacterium]|nr:UDP-glucose 4-epimerase [Bacilli bacterium]
KVIGRQLPYKIVDRRPGDIGTCYADSLHAYEVMGFKCEKTLEDMCRDSWNWQIKNPNGFEK